jgi:hypothetical protein
MLSGSQVVLSGCELLPRLWRMPQGLAWSLPSLPLCGCWPEAGLTPLGWFLEGLGPRSVIPRDDAPLPEPISRLIGGSVSPAEGRAPLSHSDIDPTLWPLRKRVSTSSQSPGRTRARRTSSLLRCWRRSSSSSERRFSLDWRTGISYIHSTFCVLHRPQGLSPSH